MIIMKYSKRSEIMNQTADGIIADQLLCFLLFLVVYGKVTVCDAKRCTEFDAFKHPWRTQYYTLNVT